MLEQRENSVRILMETVNDGACINYVMTRLLTVAYLAIRIGAYSANEYYRRYGILRNKGIWSKVNNSFQEKIFVWMALCIGYSVSRQLMELKLQYRKIFKEGCR